MQSKLFILTALVGAGLAAFVLTREAPATNATSQQDPKEALFIANQAERLQNARQRGNRAVELALYGMEHNGGGFHIVKPGFHRLGFTVSPSSSKTAEGGGMNFHATAPRDGTQFVEYFTQDLSTVGMAYERVLPSSLVKLSKAQTGTTFEVQALFSEKAAAVLSEIIGPQTANDTWRDWYRRTHQAGEPATTMYIALVASDVVYTPVSATDLGLQGGPQTLTVASGLTEAEADDMILEYNKSM